MATRGCPKRPNRTLANRAAGAGGGAHSGNCAGPRQLLPERPRPARARGCDPRRSRCRGTVLGEELCGVGDPPQNRQPGAHRWLERKWQTSWMRPPLFEVPRQGRKSRAKERPRTRTEKSPTADRRPSNYCSSAGKAYKETDASRAKGSFKVNEVPPSGTAATSMVPPW